MGSARIPLQVDIGFGDVVTPEPTEITYPTLLDLPAPTLRAYPPETVVAETLTSFIGRPVKSMVSEDPQRAKYPFPGSNSKSPKLMTTM